MSLYALSVTHFWKNKAGFCLWGCRDRKEKRKVYYEILTAGSSLETTGKMILIFGLYG